ncbi:transcriptional regulator [Nitrobacter winogradskyi]|uniref:Uncharacterized protein n=2 Tax=Nitrobacter winogradskyi TaxID=913 RepID=A0ACC6AHS2_NITWI|nr:transcriptional regulator [Nitrobacter winogradskyi]MCP1998821.1 hypothetical protein [Nitrobacter winogradskyi]GEC14257.1 hypothetical protein NWI01_01490 [Nitrobacter winogradskyi]
MFARKGEKPVGVDFIANARAGWGDPMPDWIETLAIEANRTNLGKTAHRIGIRRNVLCSVLYNKYSGNLAKIEERAREALPPPPTDCPVLGAIEQKRCLNEQRMDNTGASSIRAKLYRACRGGCPHSRLTQEDNDAGR